MKIVEVVKLKQAPYSFVLAGRVDPTYEGIEKAITEQRFSVLVMDKDYEVIKKEIFKKTRIPDEMNRLMHEYHNERVAELVRNKETWLNALDPWPIKINQFNQVIEGNHRFRACRFLGVEEIEVSVVQEEKPRRIYELREIW